MCTRGDAATPYCNSDFGSDDEDAEFRLYAQLYFETDPDAISTANNNESFASNCEEVKKLCGVSYKELQVSESQTLSPVEKTDIPVVQNISDRAVTKTIQSSCRVLERDLLFSDDCVVSSSNSNLRIPTGKQSESREHVTSPVLDERDAPNMSDTESSSIVDTESSLAGKTSSNAIEKYGTSTDLPLTVSTDTYFPSSAQEKIVAAGSQNFLNKCKSVASDSSSSHKKFASVSLPRDRLSSICSEGSIPGSLPLDSLYCNMELDDILEEDVQNRVSVFDPQTVDMYQKTKASGERRPRKRKRSESEESLQDENEDSRCDLLKNIKGQYAKKDSSLSSKKSKPAVESDSDVDLYIIGPPSPKRHEVYTLTTTSDDEGVLNIKVGPQKKKKKEKLLTGKESTVRSIISGKKQVSSDTLLNEERRCIDDILSADLIELDSDSESDTDLVELTSGTDLTLNIDQDLSPFVNRLTKHMNRTSSIRKSPKKPKRALTGENRYSLDFTLYRPDTKKNPSCDKWTQEMANFYDSDISEDLDISDVHQQQSDSPADWKIISSDYYVNNSRRYYAKQDRCTLCRQFGHPRSKCSRVPCCHMCSETDHKFRRQCPQNCCFGCGGPFHFFCMDTSYATRCTQCSYNGHREEQCPDAWRKYHLTTSGLTAQTPGSETTNRQYCCVCGKRGHFGHECPDRYRLKCSYVPVPQTILNTFVEPTADVQVIDVREVYINGCREAQASAKMVMAKSKHTPDKMVVNKKLLQYHPHWCSQFLATMIREKESVMRKIQKYRSRLKKPKNWTKEILEMTLYNLQVFQDNLWRYKKATQNSIIDQRLKDMKDVSLFLSSCDGNLEDRLGQLTSDVQACSSNIIPEEMCTKICETLGSVFAPPLKSFKHILETANSYVRSLPAGWQQELKPTRTNKKLRNALFKRQQERQLDTTNTSVDCKQVPVPGTSFNVQSVKKVKRKRGKVFKNKVKGGNSPMYQGYGIPQACAAAVPQGEGKTTTEDQKKRVKIATKKKTTDAQSTLKATGRIATNSNKKRKVFGCKKIKTFTSEVTLQET